MHVYMCIGEGHASRVRVTRDETTEEDGVGETLAEGADPANTKTTVRLLPPCRRHSPKTLRPEPGCLNPNP